MNLYLDPKQSNNIKTTMKLIKCVSKLTTSPIISCTLCQKMLLESLVILYINPSLFSNRIVVIAKSQINILVRIIGSKTVLHYPLFFYCVAILWLFLYFFLNEIDALHEVEHI